MVRIGRGRVHVVAERQRRQGGGALPRRREGHRRLVPAGDGPALVRPLEPTPTEPAEEDVPADPEHGQVDDAVTVDIERIGAGDRVEVRGGVADRGEVERSTDRAVVVVQAGPVRTSGDVRIGPSVGVAVEDGDAATGEVGERPVVDLADPRRRGLFDEPGGPEWRGRGRRPADPGDDEPDGRSDRRGPDSGDGQPAAAHPGIAATERRCLTA